MATKRKEEPRLTDDAGTRPGAAVLDAASRTAGRASADVTRAMAREEDSRESDEGREPDDREMSDEDYLERFRDQLEQSVLPNLPNQDGFHVCWLTTSNPRDTIPMRMRMGYQLIRESDLPGLNEASVKTGSYAGCVMINEMIAARIPLRLYNLYMKEAHSNRPLAEEGKLRNMVEEIKNQASSSGLEIEVGDGMAQLGKGARVMEELRE